MPGKEGQYVYYFIILPGERRIEGIRKVTGE